MANVQHSDTSYGLGSITAHRRDDFTSTQHGADVFEMQIQWQDGSTTWELEETIQTDNRNTLLRYWETAGGRERFMWDIGVWLLFRVHHHRLAQSGEGPEEYCIEWVGSRGRTWETRGNVPRAARELYWHEVQLRTGRDRRMTIFWERERRALVQVNRTTTTRRVQDTEDDQVVENYADDSVDEDYRP